MVAPERFVNFDTGQPQALRDAVNSVFGASGPNHADGLVPDPGSTPGSANFLREDGTWVVIVGLTNIGNNTVLGNVSGGLAAPVALTQAQLTALINSFTSLLPGAVPASGGGTVNFLRADGTFATPPTGAMTLLNTLTASNSAVLSDTTSLTATYSEYEIAYENLLPASAGPVSMQLQVHSGGTFQNTTYVGAILVWSGAATAVVSSTTDVRLMDANVGSGGPGLTGKVRVAAPSGTTQKKIFYGQTATADTTGANRGGAISGFWNGGNGAVDGFQIFFSAGNITSGVVKIYGIS